MIHCLNRTEGIGRTRIINELVEVNAEIRIRYERGKDGATPDTRSAQQKLNVGLPVDERGQVL